MSWRRLSTLKSCVLFLAYTFLLSACGPNAVENQPTKSLMLDSQIEGLNDAMAPLRNEAMQLQQRLANLETLIAKQDARHREIEEMIISTLDHTADQLEAFLRRVGADPSTFDATVKSVPAPAGQQPLQAGTRASSPKEVPDTLQALANDPNRSMHFMWWSLAGLTVVGGLVLLRQQQPANPLAMAPEMQVRTPPVRHSRKQEAHPQPVADEPEVEDLWATAALLGEAIGRLKHVEDPAHPNGGERKHESGATGLQDRGKGVSNHGLDPKAPTAIEDEDKLPFVAPPADLDVAQLLGLSDNVKPKEDPTPTEPLPRPTGPVAGPLFANDKDEPGQPTASSPSECEPITCRLPVAASQQTAGRVRNLLDADPRVLRSPAPKVRKLKGHLEVSFSVLPGLPDGERSLLEQQLRDTVA